MVPKREGIGATTDDTRPPPGNAGKSAGKQINRHSITSLRGTIAIRQAHGFHTPVSQPRSSCIHSQLEAEGKTWVPDAQSGESARPATRHGSSGGGGPPCAWFSSECASGKRLAVKSGAAGPPLCSGARSGRAGLSPRIESCAASAPAPRSISSSNTRPAPAGCSQTNRLANGLVLIPCPADRILMKIK